MVDIVKKNEIERKWIAESRKIIPELLGSIYDSISQFYVKIEDSFEEKYLMNNDEVFRTIKKGKGLQQEETEENVSQEIWNAFVNKLVGSIIHKKRYTKNIISKDGKVCKIKFDNYVLPPTRKNILIIEIEFPSKSDSESFQIPEKIVNEFNWVKEITGDDRFSNKNIALQGFQKIPDMPYI